MVRGLLSADTLIKQTIVTRATLPGELQLDTTADANLLGFIRSLYEPNGSPIGHSAVFRKF